MAVQIRGRAGRRATVIVQVGRLARWQPRGGCARNGQRATWGGNLQPRRVRMCRRASGLVPVTAVGGPGRNPVDTDIGFHTQDGLIFQLGRHLGSASGATGGGRKNGGGTRGRSYDTRWLPLAQLPLAFSLVHKINLRWRALGKPCWNLETVRLRGSPSWVMARLPPQCVSHAMEIPIPERRCGEVLSCSFPVPALLWKDEDHPEIWNSFPSERHFLTVVSWQKRGVRW